MQPNNNIPRASCSIPSVSLPYYLRLGQIQSGAPESHSIQTVSSSRYGRSDQYLGQIQKNEILIDMMLRKVNRKKVTVPKMCRNGKSKANENRCPNVQCKKYECNRPTCSNGVERQKDKLHNHENVQFNKQANGLRDNPINKNLRSKIPVYIKRCKAGQATNNNYPIREKGKNKQTNESILPVPLTKNALNVKQARNFQSKIPQCKKGCVAAKGTVSKRPSREDIEDFYDCQSNSRSSLNTSLKIDDVKATGSRGLTNEECETEPQTLKYSLESTILDLYEGNFKTKPTAKRDEVEACNFLLDLIKERINSISSMDKDPCIRATRSCVHMRQLGTCEFKCDKPSLTYSTDDNHNSAETREEDCNQCPQEDHCVEYEEESSITNAVIEDLSETSTMQSIAEDSLKASDHCLEDVCQCTQKHKEEPSEIAKPKSYVVEPSEIAEVKSEDGILKLERTPEAQHVEHIEESSEIVEEKPNVLVETSSRTNTIKPLVTGTSKWQLDDKQRSRGAVFGIIGYRSLQKVEESPKHSIMTEENPEYLFKERKKQKPLLIDQAQRAKGKRLSVLGLHEGIDESEPNTESRQSRQEQNTVEISKKNNQKCDKEQETDQNIEGSFKETKLQNAFDMDRTQCLKGKELGIVACKPDKIEIMEKSDTSLVIDQNNEERKPDKVNSVEKLQNVFDMDGTQCLRGKELGIVACKKQKIEVLEKSDTSLAVEQNNEESETEKVQTEKVQTEKFQTEKVQTENGQTESGQSLCMFFMKGTEVEKVQTFKNFTSQNEVIPKDQKVAEVEEPQNNVTEEIRKKPLQERNCNCSDCFPNKIPIELRNHRVNYTSTHDSNQEKFSCRIHQEQKENHNAVQQDERKITENTLAQESSKYSTNKLSADTENRRQDNHKTQKRDSASSSQEYNSPSSSKNKLPSKSEAEDTKLAFFKCLAEQIRGKRKRSRAERNNQDHIDQRNAEQLLYNTDRNVQKICCNRSTSPWVSEDTKPKEQPINVKGSICKGAIYPCAAKEPINQQTITDATKNSCFAEAESTTVLNDQISKQNSCCNRTACLSITITDIARNIRVPKEPNEQLNVQSSCSNRSACPWIAKDYIKDQTVATTARTTRVLNEPNEQLNVQNSCSNRFACPWIAKDSIKDWTVADTARTTRVLNEPKGQLIAQTSCCNRSSCPRIAKDSIKHLTVAAPAGTTRVLSEPKGQLSAQTSCCNRSSCPWIAKDSITYQTVAAPAGTTRVLSEPKGQLSAQTSCCNRSSCPWIAKDSITYQTVAATEGNTRVLNEPKGQLSAQASCCNRSTCPWMAKDSITHQTVTDILENNRVLNEPKEQIKAQSSCCNRSTCPFIAKETFKLQTSAVPVESTRVLSEPKEEIKAQTSCCNRSSCPRITKTNTTESYRVLSEPTEQINTQNSCCNSATCPRIAKKSLYQHTITDIMENSYASEAESTTVLNDSNEQNVCCNNLTCPWISKEPIKHHQAESCTILNEAQCQEPIEKVCSCKRKRCSFAENLSQEKNIEKVSSNDDLNKDQLCAAKKESIRNVIFEKQCSTAEATPTPQNTDFKEQHLDCCCSENKSNYKLLDKALSESTILNESELSCAKDSSKEINLNLESCTCKVPELEEPEEEIDSSETDNQQYVAAKNIQPECQMDPFLSQNEPNCNFCCSKMPAPECSASIHSISSSTCKEVRRNSKTICDIPPAHVPYFSEMYETHEEKQWNNPNASIQEEYFSCASCSSGSSSGSSTSSKSSNDCVVTNGNHITIVPGKWNGKTQLRQEQESCCRCLKCLAATYYEGSMQNFHRLQCPQQACNNEKTRSFANSMCQTEKSSINPCQHKDAESYCCLDGERHAPKRRADFDVIVSAGHSGNPCFNAGKRRRVQKK